MVESLLFLGAGAGVGVSEKNTWSRSRSKTDWLRNTDDVYLKNLALKLRLAAEYSKFLRTLIANRKCKLAIVAKSAKMV